MSGKWQKELELLFASAKDKAALKTLIEGLLTPAERDELAVRWQIVKLLYEGKTQREVRDKLNVSIATVTRGARELKYGNGWIQKFYKRLYAG